MNRQPVWWQSFPLLASIEDAVWAEIRDSTATVTLPAGATVFRSGDLCENYVLVLEGSIRVQKLAENGREITLYRVEKGDSCVLTTSCLLAGEHYPAEGITESEVVAAVIPLAQFQRGVDDSAGFRRFVFASYGQRVSDLLLLVEEVAFGRIDGRLASRLLELQAPTGTLDITHQALAAELGTAREVISRQLKEFERRGWIQLQRARIEVLDARQLRHLANSRERC